jgi:hypothetical protein
MSIQLLKQNLDALMLEPELDSYRFAPENLNREIVETDYYIQENKQNQNPRIDKILSDIESLANQCLITRLGCPDLSQMRELKKLSDDLYFVTKGESDGFGWLTGVINTPKGKIVFG